MTEKKMTKAMWFEAIKAVVANSEMENKEGAIAFIEHELESLAKKSSSSAPTAKQKENFVIRQEIKDALFEIAKPVTITELVAATPALARFSSQKISALLKLMKDSGEVIRTEEKKKAYFSLAQ